MKRINVTLESRSEPQDRNVFWLDKGVLRYYKDGTWPSIGAGEVLWDNIKNKPDFSDVVRVDAINTIVKFYATKQWVIDQKYLTSIPEDYATKEYVGEQIKQNAPDLTPYATMEWVNNQKYLTAVPSNYITSDMLNSTLSNYGTLEWINQQIEDSVVDLTGYATEDWVKQQGYLTNIPAEYITEAELSQQLESYATQEWVNNRGFLTSIPNSYLTETEGDNKYQPKGEYLTEEALDEYATKGYVNDEIGKIPQYTLPTASNTVLGGIKVGNRLEIEEDGTLNVIDGGTADSVSWGNITGKPSSFVTTLALITDLNSSWIEALSNSMPNYITSIPDEYVTTQELSASLTSYATQSWVQQLGYITASALADYLPLSGGKLGGNLITNNIVVTREFCIYGSNIDSDDYIKFPYIGQPFEIGSGSSIHLTTGNGSSVNGLYHRIGSDDYEILDTNNFGSITFTGAATGTFNGTNDLTINIPTGGGGVADSVAWENVTNKPTFATVATSGDYNDLSNLPTIPSLVGYATEEFVTSQGYITSIPSNYVTESELTAALAPYALATSIPSLSGYATQQWVRDQNFLTQGDMPGEVDLTGYAKESWVLSQGFITSIPSEYITQTELNSALSGYATTDNIPSLNGYATQTWVNSQGFAKTTDIPTIPTNISSFTNDSGYQTSAQVNAAIQAVVGAAPAALDTLKEIADALNNDPDFAATITNQLAQKADLSDIPDLSSYATQNWVSQQLALHTVSWSNITSKPSELGSSLHAETVVINGVTRQVLVNNVNPNQSTTTIYAPITAGTAGYVLKSNGDGEAPTWQSNTVTWSNVSGKPSTFTPSSHTHTISEITDFETPSLPVATSQVLGGIKVGYGLSVDNSGTTSVENPNLVIDLSSSSSRLIGYNDLKANPSLSVEVIDDGDYYHVTSKEIEESQIVLHYRRVEQWTTSGLFYTRTIAATIQSSGSYTTATEYMDKGILRYNPSSSIYNGPNKLVVNAYLNGIVGTLEVMDDAYGSSTRLFVSRTILSSSTIEVQCFDWRGANNGGLVINRYTIDINSGATTRTMDTLN